MNNVFGGNCGCRCVALDFSFFWTPQLRCSKLCLNFESILNYVYSDQCSGSSTWYSQYHYLAFPSVAKSLLCLILIPILFFLITPGSTCSSMQVQRSYTCVSLCVLDRVGFFQFWSLLCFSPLLQRLKMRNGDMKPLASWKPQISVPPLDDFWSSKILG